MKTKLNSLFDMLAYVLRGLHVVETKLICDFGERADQVTSTLVRCEMDEYLGGLQDNLLGIERIFSYIMTNELERKDHLVQDLIHEINLVFSSTEPSYLKDIFIVSSLRSLSAYKSSLYHTAYQIAIELELETPADILQAVLKKEQNAYEVLDKLTLTQFTNVQ